MKTRITLLTALSISIGHLMAQAPPATPPNPTTTTYSCGDQTVTRTGNPTGGAVWYWQTTYDGTDMSNNNSSITVSTTSSVYIRAYKVNSDLWSTGVGYVSVTVNNYPNAPSTPSYQSYCGYGIITRGSPPGGVTWYWQGGNSSGTSTYDAASTYTVSTNGTYYIRAYNNAGGCWSGSSTGIYVEVTPAPDTPTTPTSSGNNCGDVTLYFNGSPPQGQTTYWCWQTSSGGTSTANNTSGYVVSNSGTYFLRAYNFVTGCWSAGSSQISVTVNQPPSAPSTPSATPLCGSTDLMRGSPPGGITWYWQGTSSSGTSTSNSNTTYNVTSTGTYYLRAMNNATGCWSNSSASVTISSINPVVGQPTPTNGFHEEPGVVSNMSATMGANGNVIRWYTASTGGTYFTTGTSYSPNLSATTTYYISSAHTTTGCESARVGITAEVRPKPTINASPSVLTMGDKATLSTSNSYDAYTWKLNGITVGTASTFQASLPGTYSVTVTKSTMTGPGTGTRLIKRTIDEQSANFTVVNQIRKVGVTKTEDVETLTSGQRTRSISYFGGLGNSLQTIVSQGSPANKDLIQTSKYDIHGRQLEQYLPYASSTNDSKFRANALDNSGYTGSEQYLFYQQASIKIATDTKPFAKTEIEPSPLQRVTARTGTGNSWHTGNKKVVSQYLLNRASDNIRIWYVDAGLPKSTATYGDYQLYVNTVADENGHNIKAYTDKLGKTVLKMTEAASGTWHPTYYIYDSLERIAFILPPKGTQSLPSYTPPQSYLNLWAFQYRYDAYGRLIESRSPGRGLLCTVYDPLNRPVLTQNEDQRTRSEWSFVKYDQYGRTVVTGFKVIASSTRSSVQASVNAQSYNYEIPSSSAVGYTLSQTYPSVSESDLLTISYYDNYNFLGYSGWDAESHTFTFVPELSDTVFMRVTGLPTGSKVRKLALIPTSTWLNSVHYYDKYYRPIQSISENHIGNLDRGTVRYNFSGRLEESKLVHSGYETVTVIQKYKYDSADRVTKIYHNINGAGSDQLAAQYEYNELGQLVDKKLHNTTGTTFLQSVDFRYTIRGQLQSINNAQLSNDSGSSNDETNDYFGTELLYNAADAGLSNTQYYNGNISAVKWKSTGESSGANGQRSYKYSYDYSDRLTQATFQANSGSAWDKETNTLNESMSYDYNGNISTLTRKQNSRGLSATTVTSSAQTIDDLTYTYATGHGNRMNKVEDSSGQTAGFNNASTSNIEFKYDTLGNLRKDANKGIDSIKYNILNKVSRVKFTDGRVLTYAYDATGKLLTKTSSTGGFTDYIGQFVYDNGVLSFFGSPEGRVSKKGSNYEYQYAIADHLGNTKVIFTSAAPPNATITATFEGDSNDQAAQFANVSNVVSFTAANHTSGGIKVVRMNQSYAAGPSKSLKVYPGDKVDMEVYGYYENTSGYGTSNNTVGAMVTAIAAGFGGVSGGGGESGKIFDGVNTALGGFGLGPNPGDAAPAAFINYILFDQYYKVLDMGWTRIPTTPMTKHQMTIGQVSVKEAGYIFVYLSYEDQSNNYVYFDDFKVTHTKTSLIQASEYYAFGMRTATSWERLEETLAEPDATGLKLKLEFNGNANDNSGNANNGTINGGATTVATQGRTQSIVLDGTNDYVQVNDNSTLDFGNGNFTVAFWVRKLAPSSGWDNMSGVNKWNTGGSPGTNEWSVGMGSASNDNKPAASIEIGSTTYSAISPNAMSIGVWYHLIGMREGTNLKLYVNGVLKATTSVGSGSVNNVSGRNLLIGKLPSGLETYAAFDDIYIYNRALSTDEIKTLLVRGREVNMFLGNGGTELNSTSGIYDLDFRNYDPVLGRMYQNDPMAHAFGSVSPYNFAFNDPVSFNDPRGDYPPTINPFDFGTLYIDGEANGEFSGYNRIMTFVGGGRWSVELPREYNWRLWWYSLNS